MIAWILVFHLAGLVFWLGSLLIVTHVLAIHSEEPSMEARAALGRLEMKLLKGLAHPGAAVMMISGLLMIGENPHYLREHWLQAKLLLVALLIVLDLRVYFRTTAFLAGRVDLRRRECMALHGTISLVFFAILILALLRPFGLRVHQAFAPYRTRGANVSHLFGQTWDELAAPCGGTHGEDYCKQQRLTAGGGGIHNL